MPRSLLALRFLEQVLPPLHHRVSGRYDLTGHDHSWDAVVWLRRERQMVPEAIADYLGISDGQVRAYLRELDT
jgi:hypothetical protein